MSKEKFIQLNIAFSVPKNVAKIAIKLSKEIAEKENVYFMLDNINYFTHVTIYSVEFPESNLKEIIKKLEKLAIDFSPPEFIFEYNKAKSGWISLFFSCSPKIKTLHEAIVKTANPLREGLIREKFKISENIENLSAEQSENIKKYGNPNLMNLYKPHLTITKLKNEQIAEKFASEMSGKIEKFKSDSIGIFVSGKHGTCRKLIKEFKLGK